VEQFIRKFKDVATITEWPAPVRVLQHRACLTGRAKSFALRPDEAHILRALRTRFDMTSEEASDRLKVMRRDRRWKRLAQVAFGHATGPEKQCLVYSTFFKIINHPALQRHWMAAKVSSLDVALEMGKAYFQVEELQGPRFTARQVVEEETPMPANPQVAAAATDSSRPTQPTMLMDMVKGLQATVA